MNFPDVLKQLRKERNLTQDELAKNVKVNRSTLGMYESGRREPNYETLEIFADYFNVPIDKLLGRAVTSNSLPALTKKDNREIQKKLDALMNDLDPATGIAYYNGDEPMDDEDRELLKISLKNSLELAKQIAKKKFTPKKYRK